MMQMLTPEEIKTAIHDYQTTPTNENFKKLHDNFKPRIDKLVRRTISKMMCPDDAADIKSAITIALVQTVKSIRVTSLTAAEIVLVINLELEKSADLAVRRF
jgi:hypothetical protein